MKYIKLFTAFILALSLLVLLACSKTEVKKEGHDQNEQASIVSDETNHTEKDVDHDEGGEHEDGIVLTQKQAQTIDLSLGDFTSIRINDFITATGTLGLPPNAQSSVSVKTNGILNSRSKFVEGDYIKKGQLIATLKNPEFLVTQQLYLERMAELNLKRLEVERQRTLVNEDAGVEKNLQTAQAEVAVLEATTTGLAKQLNYLGISADNLTINSIQQEISITAPMSGYISKVNFHDGMYAQSPDPIMEIISTNHMHLELDVFEKDISKIKKGQKITYTVPAYENKVFEGKISVIGKEFNSNSKTVRVHGHLEDNGPNFIRELFLNAKIWLTDNTTQALPNKAIIKDGNNTFIYTTKDNVNSDELQFERVNVITGATIDGNTGVKLVNELPENSKIVINGAYYVYAQSKAGELSHEH